MKDNRDLERSRDRFPSVESDLHRTLYPGDIRKDDRVVAKLKYDSQFIDSTLWRMSPFGIELVVKSDQAPEQGSTTQIELTIEGITNRYSGVVVEAISPFVESKELLIGVRFTADEENTERKDESERRKEERWICSEYFYPTCVSPTPGRLNDYIYFRIHDISPSGMRMRCSLRNKHLLPDMRLELFAQFPATETAQIDVVVKRIKIEEEAGKDVLSLGVEFCELNDRAKQSIGQYLMQFSASATAAEIKQSGFEIDSVARGIEFYFLKTQSDYEKVLELRRLVHIKDGNITSDTSAAEMGDINDSSSRIIIGKINNEVVATARLRYNQSDAPLEHEAHLNLPTTFPRRDQIVEISRAAIHPSYRQGDLFAALWRYMATYAVQKQRPYALIGSTKQLIPFYKKCGFRETGLTHGEEIWTIQQHLMLCNVHETMVGKNANPLYWNQLYEPGVERAIEAGIISPNAMDKIRIRAYRKLGWITKLKFRKLKKRRS